MGSIVAAQKRRKSSGVTSALADALRDQQQARQQTLRLEQQAAAAHTKEGTRAASAAREKAKQDRQSERENQIVVGHAEAEAVTRALQARLTELETLLKSTLDEDPYIVFAHLKEPMSLQRFRPPESLIIPEPQPLENGFLPGQPTGLLALSPGRKRAYAAALEDGRASYAQALARHAQAERDRQQRLARAHADHEQITVKERLRIQKQHELVDRWADDFAAGKRKAVADYFREVLAAQRYPSDFPTGVKVAYLPAEHQLVADIDLPLLDAIPELASCEYQPTKKALKHTRMREPARNMLYQLVIAQMALRTLRSLFLADWNRLAGTVVCNGYVDTINTATGQPAHWCLVTLEVKRELFEELDLALVKPLDCLAYLHAKISRTPEKCIPVQPILEYPWDDLPYSDELDSAAGLDTVQNLLELDGYEFERLIVQLFEAIPAFDEVRRTRSRADGGIDLVAVNTTPFIGGRVAVQAKRYAPHRKVDIATIREIVGSISQRDFNKGIVITTSDFTRAAREEASRLGVELYDRERLLWLLRHHLRREFNIIDETRRKPPIKSPQ
jgi:restriction system protein